MLLNVNTNANSNVILIRATFGLCLEGRPSALFATESMDWAPTVNLGYESGGTELKSSSSVRRDEKMKQKEDLQSRLECAGTMLDLQQIREASTSDWDHTDESDEQDGYHRSDGTTKDAGSEALCCTYKTS